MISTAQAGSTIVWLAGQTGRRKDGTIGEDSATQTADAFLNLWVLMESVGATPRNIACLRTYVTPGAEEGFYRGRQGVFSDWYPDRDYPVNTLAIVTGLADTRAMVEIEAVLALHPRK